jgi:hypothetical protein
VQKKNHKFRQERGGGNYPEGGGPAQRTESRQEVSSQEDPDSRCGGFTAGPALAGQSQTRAPTES